MAKPKCECGRSLTTCGEVMELSIHSLAEEVRLVYTCPRCGDRSVAETSLPHGDVQRLAVARRISCRRLVCRCGNTMSAPGRPSVRVEVGCPLIWANWKLNRALTRVFRWMPAGRCFPALSPLVLSRRGEIREDTGLAESCEV